MALGSVQSVLVCAQVASASVSDQQLCGGPVNGQFFAPRPVSAYLVDPAQVSGLEASVAPIDYQMAGNFWGFGFSSVIGLYLFSYCIGELIRFVRRQGRS